MEQLLKILILEDSETDAEILQRFLLKQGVHCEFRLAMTKKNFLAALDEFSPNVILSDNSLPGFNAADALKITRQQYLYVPFIMVTGTVSEEYAASIIKEGADDYILKDRMARLPAAIEAALQQRKTLKELIDYRYALDESAIVAITDQKGIILYANANFLKISKYTASELIGQDHRIINSGYHPPSYIKNMWATIANGRVWQGEFRNRAKDGSLYWVDTNIIPLLNEKGKPYQYLAIRTDITKRKRAEELLVEREAQLELFIEHSPASLAMFDCDMRYLAVSRRWIYDYQLKEQTLIGKSHYEIFPGIPQHWKDIHERCLNGEIIKNEEDSFTISDGSTAWLRWEIRPWYKASGDIGGIIIFSEDITGRKKAIEDILQSQMRLKQAQEISHLGSWELNFKTNIPKWSDEAYRIYGLEPGDELSMDEWLTFVHPDELQAVSRKIEKSQIEMRDLTLNLRIIRKDGRIRHIYSETKYEFSEEGAPVAMYGIVHDITESKEAEEELRLSEMRLKEAQAIAHISNWEIDLVHNVHTWSDEFYRIYGLDKAKTKPSAELFLLLMHPDDAGFAQAKVQEAFETLANSSFDFRFIRSDGTTRHGYTEWRFELDKNKKPLRLFGIMQDITERKEAEENLKLMEKTMLEQRIAEQKKIARAIITGQEKERNHIGKELHDNINQILAGTKMYLSIAGKKNEEVKEAIRYPMELIDSSIEEIRLLCQKLVTPLKNINLKEMITMLLTGVKENTTLKTKLTYTIPEDLLSDDLKLNIFRIIQEQVNNIIKYAGAKKLSISLATGDNAILIVTEDDGIGFDVDKKRTGIGISNMINRAETFNGWVEIRSKPGKGCKISIKIPHSV